MSTFQFKYIFVCFLLMMIYVNRWWFLYLFLILILFIFLIWFFAHCFVLLHLLATLSTITRRESKPQWKNLIYGESAMNFLILRVHEIRNMSIITIYCVPFVLIIARGNKTRFLSTAWICASWIRDLARILCFITKWYYISMIIRKKTRNLRVI